MNMAANRSTVSKAKFVAKLVTEEKGPCAFCQHDVDDELVYGKLYAIGNIKCHYFCVLLSCCLIQKGRDEEGLFGFLYPDILAEIERSKKHKCSYCNREGATLGCCVGQCRKQFHLPCGRQRKAVSLFYGSYKSFCQNHAPKQKIDDNVMAKAKVRMRQDRTKAKTAKKSVVKQEYGEINLESESVCVICYEPVQGYPTVDTFWPPCCARDAWFHRSCLQRMALSAGMHYLKCPLCNDKENFYEAIVSQGYYVPDRDAAWELEQNAFAEIYERPLRCDVEECKCPMGRNHDSDTGMWDIKMCLLCGSSGGHVHCLPNEDASRYVCNSCLPAAPDNLEELASNIEAVIIREQSAMSPSRPRPVMPSRMSLRRTKQRVAYNAASSSRSHGVNINNGNDDSVSSPKQDTATSRLELNLKPPKTPRKLDTVLQLENKFMSPVKMLQQELYEKVSRIGANATDVVIDDKVFEEVRKRFKKPKPLSEKKKIVNEILDNILNNMKEKPKNKEPLREWCSPRKCMEIKQEDIKLEQENIEPYIESNQNVTPKTTPKKIYHELIIMDDETQDANNFFDREYDEMRCNQEINNVEGVENKINEIKNEDSSNSTFQLPPEFIADTQSDDSLPLFDTPKLKTVDIQKDSSLEISENNEVVNVNVVKMEQSTPKLKLKFLKSNKIDLSPIKNKKCALKFSPVDKETLQTNNIDIDLESFKNHYLNEVGRDSKPKLNVDHTEIDENIQPQTKVKRKRKIKDEASVVKKKKIRKDKSNKSKDRKRKMKSETKRNKDKYILKYKQRNAQIEVCKGNDNLKLSMAERRKTKKKLTKVSIKDKDIKVKIKWKREKLKLKITEAKQLEKSPKNLKQYVLNCTEGRSKDVLEKPVHDVSPIKRKYVKQEKPSDNLKQTNIQSFFKIQVPKKQ